MYELPFDWLKKALNPLTVSTKICKKIERTFQAPPTASSAFVGQLRSVATTFRAFYRTVTCTTGKCQYLHNVCDI